MRFKVFLAMKVYRKYQSELVSTILPRLESPDSAAMSLAILCSLVFTGD